MIRKLPLKLWQIDAFASEPLEGNPAAIVPLEAWLDAELMQRIANENNLAETAFFVKTAPGKYDLRWFTPAAEVDLCGHATLASAWLIFDSLEPDLKSVAFETRSGTLSVERGHDGRHSMSLPADPVLPFAQAKEFEILIAEALGVPPPSEILTGRYLMGVWNDPKTIRALEGSGDIARVLRKAGQWGFIATAPGDGDLDFISRFFAPDKGVPEDPVTGSAHCALTPYWARRLEKTTLHARQVSPRGGDVTCTDASERIILSGPCALYMVGEIAL